jgi:osmotically-inducible protein OsmY
MTMQQKPLALAALLVLATGFLGGCLAVATGAVVTSIVVAQDRRSVGKVIDDNVIEFRVTEQISKQVGKNARVRANATSVNGIVLLTGEVPDQARLDLVLAATRSVQNVRQIVNEMHIREPLDGKTVANDSWIASQVKARLFKAVGADDAVRINVHVNDHVVYLMGLLDHKTADGAAGSARTIRGVSQVVKVFEYID